MLTTVIGAFPKPSYLKITDWFNAAGGTDTAGIQRMNPGGSIAGAVSVPTRHIHQSIEMVHKEDVRGAIDLLRHSVENLHTYDWSFR